MLIHISTAKMYKIGHLLFEFHTHCGPTFLRHCDWEPKAQQYPRPQRDWQVLHKWCRLRKEDQEEYRI